MFLRSFITISLKIYSIVKLRYFIYLFFTLVYHNIFYTSDKQRDTICVKIHVRRQLGRRTHSPLTYFVMSSGVEWFLSWTPEIARIEILYVQSIRRHA